MSATPSDAVDRTPPEQRLVNLVVALMATQHGLTKETILQSVAGYRQRSAAGVSKDALEKMFERDKESLRSLGVPVETIGDRLDPADLRNARYRIPSAEYAVPSDIEFTAQEVAVLAVAGAVWSRSSLSDDARAGLRKIRASGADVDEPVIGISPRLTVRTTAFSALQQALDDGRVVDFDYVKPGDAHARTRRVWPLALVEYEARWHLFGFDEQAEADRTFLLSRIAGSVRQTGGGFDPALRVGAGARALAGLQRLAARQRAVVQVEPGSEAALRLRRRAETVGTAVGVHYVDVSVLADELASYGPEVRVLEPPRLREAVIDRLRGARDRHAGAR